MTTAIYIRTSTDDQNPENQLHDCKSLTKEDYNLYVDKQSAWKEDVERQDFNKLLKEIKEGKVSSLIVWDLDRIYRNRKKLLEFFQICKAYKCTVFSYRQGFLNDIQNLTLPEGFGFIKDMMVDNFLHFLGWMAEEESIKKSKRIKASMRQKEDGVYSYKGNKWGRARLSTFKRNKISQLSKEGKSIRIIAKEIGVSVGGVHKYLQELNNSKSQNEGVSTVRY